jgi:hypothetical protein
MTMRALVPERAPAHDRRRFHPDVAGDPFAWVR